MTEYLYFEIMRTDCLYLISTSCEHGRHFCGRAWPNTKVPPWENVPRSLPRYHPASHNVIETAYIMFRTALGVHCASPTQTWQKGKDDGEKIWQPSPGSFERIKLTTGCFTFFFLWGFQGNMTHFRSLPTWSVVIRLLDDSQKYWVISLPCLASGWKRCSLIGGRGALDPSITPIRIHWHTCTILKSSKAHSFVFHLHVKTHLIMS